MAIIGRREHPRGCCDPKQEAELQKRFKKRLAELGLKGKGAREPGWLSRIECEHGPNVVIYPDAVWYGNVQLDDVDEIVESHIIGGVPVARLMIKETCLNARSCEHKQRRAED